MSKDRLCSPQRLSDLSEQRCMGVPEAMPANNWQAKLSASRLQHSSEKILRIERRAVATGKDQSLRISSRQNISLRQECLAYWPAHWHIPATTLGLRAPKTPLIDVLAHVDCAVDEIDVLPAKRE